MSLQLWKNLDDYLDDPWRNDRSLLPYWGRRHQWRDDYGLDLYRREQLSVPWKTRELEWQFRDLERRLRDEFSPTISRTGFQVCVDVAPFSPSEITVKTTYNSVTIEAKHVESRFGRGFISREITRKYALPIGSNANKITSEISSDGFLTIKVPFY